MRPRTADWPNRQNASQLNTQGRRAPLITDATKSDVLILKSELHDLLRERTLLKANLVRLRDNLKDPRSHQISKEMLANTSKDIKKITDYNATRRKEIAAVLASDTAAAVSENQEESLLLYQEVLRLGNVRRDLEAQLKQVNDEIESLAVSYSPESIREREAKLAALDAEIAKQREKNSTLIKSISRARADATKETSKPPNPAVTALEERLRKEEETQAQLNSEIAARRARYESELKELEESI